MYFRNRKRDVYNSNHVEHSWNNYRRFRLYAKGGSLRASASHLRDQKFTNKIRGFFSVSPTPRPPSLLLVFSSSCLYFFPLYTSLSFSLSVVLHFYLSPAFLSIYRPLSLFASHIHRRLSTIVNIGYPLWNIGWYRIFSTCGQYSPQPIRTRVSGSTLGLYR